MAGLLVASTLAGGFVHVHAAANRPAPQANRERATTVPTRPQSAPPARSFEEDLAAALAGYPFCAPEPAAAPTPVASATPGAGPATAPASTLPGPLHIRVVPEISFQLPVARPGALTQLVPMYVPQPDDLHVIPLYAPEPGDVQYVHREPGPLTPQKSPR